MISRLLARLFGQGSDQRMPDALWQSTVDSLPFLARLNETELGQLRELADAFLGEKEFTAVGGLELDDTICASIAVQGCLPILKLGLDWYQGWVGIVVYPDEFVIPRSVQDEDGVVHEYDEVAAGEAWGGGPLLISWRDVQMAGEGYNVVIHEFAHKLDMLNGEADGIPPLHTGMDRAAWIKTLDAAYDDFCQRVDAAEASGRETEIDPYASEHPGEFFAVLSETLFEDPALLARSYPQLYRMLAEFYRIDPDDWLSR